MNEELMKLIEEKLGTAVDEALKKNLGKELDTMVSERVKRAVAVIRVEREQGREFLTGEQKQILVDAFVKAKAQISETPETGGILIPPEVYAGIFRVAQTVGLVPRFATKIPIAGNEVTVPRYTGSVLQGEYLNEDAEGTETTVNIGNAVLRTRKWSTLFRIDNSLLKSSNVNLADWLVGLIAEGLAYQIDKQGFTGTGAPFAGLLNNADITVLTMAATKTTYAKFDLDEANDLIAKLEESQLDGSAFFFHKTVLAALRKLKDTAGAYLITNPTPALMSDLGSGLKPQGFILNFPVFTSPVLPATSDGSQASKIFGVFGNLRGLFYGDKGTLEIARSDSATVGGKNVFAAYQTAFRALNEHALAVGLPGSFALVKTAAS
jgi:HK97 family phage major capsid protein